MKIRFLILLIVIVSFASTIQSQVVETSSGTVEFIGLEQWTPKIIQEKLGYNSSDQLHHCAASLKKIGFPDSVVMLYPEGDKTYTVITVVEPQYAEQVQYRSKPSASVAIADEWQNLMQIVEEKKFINGLLNYGSALGKKAITTDPQIKAEAWWKLLQERRSKKDYTLALKMLAGDSDVNNRIIAALILANFPEQDAAWLALVDGVRDENYLVSLTSIQALITLSKYTPKDVNWLPAASGIHHVLNGTNLFAFKPVINALIKTKASRKLARPLLRDGGSRLLLAYLKASHKEEKELARDLLIQLSGKDYGFDSVRWEKWISSL